MKHHNLINVMAGTNCYCLRCKQPLIEIDHRGQSLKGCPNCNVWWALRGGSKPRLAQEELRSLNAAPAAYDPATG